MPEQTQNRGLNIPDTGSRYWHEPVNENWATIDEDLQQAIDMASSTSGGGGDGGGGAFNGYRMVDVPGDYSTIQAAVNNSVPVLSTGGAVQIDVSPGHYDEDIYVGPYLTGSSDGGNLRIEGDRNNPRDYTIGSLVVNGCHGINAPEIRGLTPTRENTTISSGMSVAFFNCSNSKVDGMAFEPEGSGNFEEGISFYGATQGQVANVDVSNCDYGIVAKGQSIVDVTDATGHAGDYPYWATETARIGWRFSDATAGSSSSYFDLVQLDNSSLAGGRNSTKAKNLTVGGTLNVTGSKNFVHPLEDGRKAFYTAQEGDDVRAIKEGTDEIVNGNAIIDLPFHYDEVTSDTDPDLVVESTPYEVVDRPPAPVERSTTEIRFECPYDIEFSWRVSAVREDYEDEETVRDEEI